jgi:hypothetical protein
MKEERQKALEARGRGRSSDILARGLRGHTARLKRKMQRQQRDAFLCRPSVLRFDHLVSVRA